MLRTWVYRFFQVTGEASSGVLTAEYMRGGPVAALLHGIGLLPTRKRVPEPHLIGRIMRLLENPAARVLTAPLFYFLNLGLRGPLVIVSARKPPAGTA